MTLTAERRGRLEAIATGNEQPPPPDPIAAAEQLAELLELPSVGVSIRGAELFGSGSRATAEIALSNGETMTFDALKDMANMGMLAAELVACTGATPKLTKANALRAVALLRNVARHHRTMSDNDAAIEWGVSYLQVADVLDVDLENQGDRWAAFSRLAEIDPWSKAREDGTSVASAGLVLRHTDSMRLVRSSWFASHVKHQDATASQRDVATRMSRVGWQRRGSEGRMKATRPGMQGQLNWAFFIVPADWENR